MAYADAKCSHEYTEYSFEMIERIFVSLETNIFYYLCVITRFLYILEGSKILFLPKLLIISLCLMHFVAMIILL